ncbi:hypothetical protein FA95DRAFT_1568151 [Auriscalpium vulgare]|uniref:Uncharacterized protein n=1 Tax=Auriscalpium vulgare TaxID=40419 RepID=A0ACB8R0P1_9AGAM|nr:hypothetical protein FA95DRAFT_1568151 [Auriscalpium vulgare]
MPPTQTWRAALPSPQLVALAPAAPRGCPHHLEERRHADGARFASLAGDSQRSIEGCKARDRARCSETRRSVE